MIKIELVNLLLKPREEYKIAPPLPATAVLFIKVESDKMILKLLKLTAPPLLLAVLLIKIQLLKVPLIPAQ